MCPSNFSFTISAAVSCLACVVVAAAAGPLAGPGMVRTLGSGVSLSVPGLDRHIVILQDRIPIEPEPTDLKVTVQVPVYDEPFDVRDDLEHLDTNPRAQARLRLYENLGISFTVRKFAGRRGKFKKAGNLNFARVLENVAG